MSILPALAAVFAGQFVKGVTGFGSALVAVPILAAVYGPQKAVFLTTFVDMFSGFTLLRSVLHLVRWRLVMAIYIPMVLGQWIGTELLTTLPAHQTQVVVGVVIATFALTMLLRPNPPGLGELEDLPDTGRAKLYGLGTGAGTLAGILAGLVGTPGPPVVIFVKRYFVPKFFRAQVIATFSLSAATLVPMLFYKGIPGPGDVWLAMGLCVPMVLGALTGERISGRLDKVTFTRAVGGILFVAGLALAL